MADNSLPKNMGKKIADALKKQNVADEQTFAQEQEVDYTPEYATPEAFTAPEPEAAPSFDYGYPQDVAEEIPLFKVDSSEINENPELKLSIDAEEDVEEFEMPNNINVLRRLIGQLPSGVPRQTGAQIIRQTIEALGIPMKSVLQDAQRVRDCLNSSIKDCSYTIQEYKSNIKNLEKQSTGYQRQLAKLNDIIGLFVHNEKK